MKKVFFTPGPTELFFTYKDHLKSALDEQLGSISHRSKRFQEVFRHTVEQLSELLQLPSNYRIVFATSATECWERIAQNLVTERSHHFVNGAFGEKFYKVSKAYGRDASIDWIEGQFKPEKVGAELIALTMNETSSGFMHSMENLRELRQLNPEALIALDVVSATPAIDVDFSLVDTAYFSVQKCFGMPPGLSVWIVNERAIEKAKEIRHPSYHSLPNLLTQADNFQNPCTPNMFAIYIIGKIAEDLNRRGVSAVRSEINYKSALIYQTLQNHPNFHLEIESKEHRSKTIAVAKSELGSHKTIEFLRQRKMEIGSGYAAHKDTHIRIANFPTHSKEQVEYLCDTLENFA